MRSAFYLPGDPVNAATCVVLAFLIELKMVVIARESIGSSAEYLFLTICYPIVKYEVPTQLNLYLSLQVATP